MSLRAVLCLCVCVVMLQSVNGDFYRATENYEDIYINMKHRRGDEEWPFDKYFKEKNTVNLTLYYESLCPACRNFFGTQLAPTVEQLRQYLNVELIPYGNARTYEQDGKYAFRCQHGKKECYGNKLQACVIDSIQDSYQVITLNACLMRMGSTDDDLENCGQSLNLNTDAISKCARGERGSQLLKSYGDKTKSVNLKYVPLVIINDSRDHDEEASSNLFELVCKLLPSPPNICNSGYIVS